MSFGYDYSCTTLSQEGRIYQLEYAEKAVESAPSCMGVVCSDGVLLLSEKVRLYKKVKYFFTFKISHNLRCLSISGLVKDCFTFCDQQ